MWTQDGVENSSDNCLCGGGKESHGGYMNDCALKEEGDAQGVSAWARGRREEDAEEVWEELGSFGGDQAGDFELS